MVTPRKLTWPIDMDQAGRDAGPDTSRRGSLDSEATIWRRNPNATCGLRLGFPLDDPSRLPQIKRPRSLKPELIDRGRLN
jgi:hypothetical protein